MVDCLEMKLNISEVNISKDWLVDTKCIEFPTSLKIGGSKTEDTKIYLELFLDSCRIDVDEDCEISYPDQSNPGTNITEVVDIPNQTDYFQEYDFSVGFVDLSADIDNFEKPIVKNVNEFTYYVHAIAEQKFTNTLQQLKIETESGWIKKSTKEESGLQLEN